MRIGELVGADYVLSVSLASLTMEKRIFDGYFVNTENAVYRLRLNYNLYENGGSVSGVSGDSVTVSKSVRATESMSVENGDIVDSLLDSAAESAAKTGSNPRIPKHADPTQGFTSQNQGETLLTAEPQTAPGVRIFG